MNAKSNFNPRVLTWLVSFAVGIIFSVGLVISGMTQPDKVQGFLNVAGIFNSAHFGMWDASLAFVMGGAVLVTLLGFLWCAKHIKSPWLALKFEFPKNTYIDIRLIIGSALFGVGWGLSGYCPGPALASILTGGIPVLVFVVAMLTGMIVAKRWLK